MDEIEVSELSTANSIVIALKEKGFKAYFAGGFVRDSMLNIESHDIDIATDATPDQIEELFPSTIPVGKQFGVILVNQNKHQFEIATFRTDSSTSDGRRPDSVTFADARGDAARRDLTINGLFLDPITGEIFDYVQGIKDIENKIVRFVGVPEERIIEDNLRMLRAVRFAAKLGFKLDERSAFAIKMNAELINNVCAESMKKELDKVMLTKKPSVIFEMLEEVGLLKHIFPEVHALVGEKHSARWHAEADDVFGHVMIVLDNVREQSDDLNVLYSALLHDIGKPATAKPSLLGDISNHGHDDIGAEMAVARMLALKFSTKDQAMVESLVQDHMKFHIAKDLKKSKLRKFIAQDNMDLLLILGSADAKASKRRDESDEDRADGAIFINEAIEKFGTVFEDKQSIDASLPAKLVTGFDLIQLGVKQGPQFKVIIEAMFDHQLEESITNKDDMLEVLKDFMANDKKLILDQSF